MVRPSGDRKVIDDNTDKGGLGVTDNSARERLVTDADRVRFRREITEAVEWLARYGADEAGGVTRLLYDAAWSSAQRALAEKMAADGLRPYFDDVGNLFGRLEGRKPGLPKIVTGSHVDTVVSGGKLDGAYGVLAGMIALKFLREKFGPPLRTLEAASLCEEEGSRFPLTYWGSGNVCGKYDIASVPNLCDADGVSLKEAMETAGFGLGLHASPRRNDIAAFIELHIEQGYVLEREGLALGIVDGIVGQRRFAVRVEGAANHAGTTPMPGRRDAVAGACEMIGWLERAALAREDGLVATAGRLEVRPNVANVIAGEAVFSVDVRDKDAGELDRFCGAFRQSFAEIAARRGLSVEVSEWMNAEPVRMSEEMNRAMMSVCEAAGYSYRSMYSGAGHDSQVFRGAFPTTMLFVPSRDGISHSPLEHTEPEQLADGIAALAEWLFLHAYKEEFIHEKI
ncbi:MULTISPECIES: Zn-dependent hydrolase [Cohnella]|uniref:Zn-dependent hydrolase n=1 Tax=Cohnella TaxID=329857 RepID=UPI0009BC1A84|nr:MULTISPECIES: Zn-dependent hydrolase [Cohnella]MBN2980035.1 Zn-dependent hydrolase [Cohnella algarum]